MNISVIIPTLNKLPRLKLVLASLMNQINVSCDVEVIIIDDNSTDETNIFLTSKKFPFKLNYYKNSTAKGRAYSRNKGLELAKNELIIFIDDDVILEPDFINQHYSIQNKKNCIAHGKIMDLPFLRYFANPSAGIFYHDFAKPNRNTSLLKFLITENDVISNFNAICSQAKIANLEKIIQTCLSNLPGVIDWIAFTGGNLSAPKSWIIDAGGFDEKFGLTWGCEDLELGYRLFKRKFPFKYASNAIDYHIVHFRANYAEEHHKNAKYFFNKHHESKILLFQNLVNKIISQNEFLEMLKAR